MQGIGANFIDGKPNIKYCPQRPVELHEIAALPPAAPSPPSPKVVVRRRPVPPTAGASTSLGRPKSAVAATGVTAPSTVAVVADGQVQDLGVLNSHQNQVRPSTTQGNAGNGQASDQQVQPVSTIPPTARPHGRPQSSPAMRGSPPTGNTEAGPPSTKPRTTRFATRNEAAKGAASPLRGRSATVEGNMPKQPTTRRPQTADGRDIEATRHRTPFLDDPTDPVMIAHRFVSVRYIWRDVSPHNSTLIYAGFVGAGPAPLKSVHDVEIIIKCYDTDR